MKAPAWWDVKRPPMAEQAAAVLAGEDAAAEALVARAKDLGAALAKLPKRHPAHEAWVKVQDAAGCVVEHRRALAAEVSRRSGSPDAADLLRRIVAAWRDDEIGSIDGALIEEAEALLGIEAEPDPLAVPWTVPWTAPGGRS